MGAAAVDEISGGRFMLGLGAGHKSAIEDRHGLAYDRPTLRMREIAGIVRRALTGEPVNFEARHSDYPPPNYPDGRCERMCPSISRVSGRVLWSSQEKSRTGHS